MPLCLLYQLIFLRPTGGTCAFLERPPTPGQRTAIIPDKNNLAAEKRGKTDFAVLFRLIPKDGFQSEKQL
jgi:hypothetical protein